MRPAGRVFETPALNGFKVIFFTLFFRSTMDDDLGPSKNNAASRLCDHCSSKFTLFNRKVTPLNNYLITVKLGFNDHVNNEQIEIHFEVPNGMYKLLEHIVYYNI